MSCWYEVFDNEHVQLNTRRKVSVLGAVMLGALVLTISAAAATFAGPLPIVAGMFFIVGGWLLTVAWCGIRFRRLRRLAWCLRISDDGIVAYDYSRKKTVIPWDEVSQIEWAGESLLISGPPPCSIEIPHLFSEFSTLSHVILDEAEHHSVSILVEGRTLESVSAEQLYPFLAELEIASASRADDNGLTLRGG